MTVIYNGKKIKVKAILNEDGSYKLFKGENKNYYPAEVLYDNCPQIKNK